MDWCRANIGVGSKDAEEQFGSSVNSKISSSDLPFSLKEPLLIPRHHHPKTVTTTTTNTTSTRSTFDYLPNNLLKVLLLNLLDSPAYSNLSTDFLVHRFNPNTPDNPDVHYFSVAGRTKRKLNLIHPLWLPTIVLDEYEERRAREAGLRGHDGLVTVDSARWGTFLGVVDGTDHWEMRGSSAFGSTSKTPTPKTADELMDQQTKSSWQDVNRYVGRWLGSSPKPLPRPIPEQHEEVCRDLEAYVNQEPNKPSLYALADWLARRLPGSSSATSTQSLEHFRSTIDPGFPLDDLGESQSMPIAADSHQLPSSRAIALEGNEKFDLEIFYTALCRNLYDHGF